MVVTQHSERRCHASTARTSPLERFTVDSTTDNMPSLQLTTTDPQDKTGTTFLDMEIYVSEDRKALLTRSHIKKESAHQYIMESSNHPPSTFLAVVRQAVSRELRLNSEMTWLQQRLRELCIRFAKRGYSVDKLNKWIYDQVVRQMSNWTANKRLQTRQQDTTTQKGIFSTTFSEQNGQQMVRTPRRWNPFIVRQGFSHPMDFVMHKTKTDQISSTVPFRMPHIAPVHAQRIGHQLHQTYTAVGVSTEDATPVVAWILRDNIQKLTVSARETGSGRPLEDDGLISNNRRSRSEDAAQPEETTNDQDNAAEATQDRILDRASAKRIRQERDDVDTPMCST